MLRFDTWTLVVQPSLNGTTQPVPFCRYAHVDGSPESTSVTIAAPFADFALPVGWRGQCGGGVSIPATNVASEMHAA